MNTLKKSLIIAGFATVATVTAAAPTFATIEECIKEKYPNLSFEYSNEYPVKCPVYELKDGTKMVTYGKKSADCADAYNIGQDQDYYCGSDTEDASKDTSEKDDPEEDTKKDTEKDTSKKKTTEIDTGVGSVSMTTDGSSGSSLPIILFIVFAVIMIGLSVFIKIMKAKRLFNGVKEVVNAVKDHNEQQQVEREMQPDNPFMNGQPIQPAIPDDPVQPAQPAEPAATAPAPAEPVPPTQLADPGQPVDPTQPTSLQ